MNLEIKREKRIEIYAGKIDGKQFEVHVDITNVPEIVEEYSSTGSLTEDELDCIYEAICNNQK
jgi:hypothetical protein